MSWELNDKVSIYGQLVQIIRQRIISGQYGPGAKIDSVRDLAMEAGVNPNTMQRALTELEREGILHTERTSGRFVTEDREVVAAMRSKEGKEKTQMLVKELLALGFSPKEIQTLIKEQLQEEER